MTKKTQLEVVDENSNDDDAKTARIEFRGNTFTIPKDMDDWETEACLSLSQGDYVLAAKQLLGPSQWALLQTLGSKRRDIRAFLTVFADVIDKECD